MEEELDRDDPGIPEPQVKKKGFLLQSFRQMPPRTVLFSYVIEIGILRKIPISMMLEKTTFLDGIWWYFFNFHENFVT